MVRIEHQLSVRHLGLVDYIKTWESMKEFVEQRHESTVDEFWVLEHPPVFTLGQASRLEHVLCPGMIPVVQVDRGGQVTYHGPGQLVIYLLLDLKRKHLGPRHLVEVIEKSIIRLLHHRGVESAIREGAPGVYVENRKVASLGLRIRRGCSFHGLALNVDMQLEPFSRINPCGIEGLEVTQLANLGIHQPIPTVACELVGLLAEELGYDDINQDFLESDQL